MDSRRRVAADMADAAQAWLSSLGASQRDRAARPFPDSDERERWFYTPTDHGGLTLADMTTSQQQLALQLLASGLSPAGYATAVTIIGLENVLDAVDGWPRGGGLLDRQRPRDPGLYYFRVFGIPSADSSWGWRVGGHHLSVNVTVVGGKVVSTSPAFFGTDPATVPLLGGHALRPLAAFDDLAHELVASLDAEQRHEAVLTPVAPPDVVGGNRSQLRPGDRPLPVGEIFRQRLEGERAATFDALQRAVEQGLGWSQDHESAVTLAAQPRGVAATRLRPAQREALRRLLFAYLDRVPDGLRTAASDEIAAGLDGFAFAWAGSVEPGEPHYYRVQGGDTVVEYDNTQRNANHVHAVWRSLSDDFGRSALARHYAEEHTPTP